MVDILIGTHRVLSKDVEFKNLGLLIVDEEQRFGVTHKEKLKDERNGGCTDLDCDADTENAPYELDRYPGYECSGGTASGQNAHTDLCNGI